MNHARKRWLILLTLVALGGAVAALTASAGRVSAAPARHDARGSRRWLGPVPLDRAAARRRERHGALQLPARRSRSLLRPGPDPRRVRHPAAARPRPRRERQDDRDHRRLRQPDDPVRPRGVRLALGAPRSDELPGRRAVRGRPDRPDQRRRLGRRDLARRRVVARGRSGRQDPARGGEVERRRRHPERDAVGPRPQRRRRALAELRRGRAVHGSGAAPAAARPVPQPDAQGDHAVRLLRRPGRRPVHVRRLRLLQGHEHAGERPVRHLRGRDGVERGRDDAARTSPSRRGTSRRSSATRSPAAAASRSSTTSPTTRSTWCRARTCGRCRTSPTTRASTPA